jgi:hypothetical protein
VSDVIQAIQAYTEGAPHAVVARSDTTASMVTLLKLNYPPVQEVTLDFAWSGSCDRSNGKYTLSRAERAEAGEGEEGEGGEEGKEGKEGKEAEVL